MDALGRPTSSYGNPPGQLGYHVSETDFHYYRTMLVELGWGADGNALPTNDGFRNIAYGDTAGGYPQNPYVHAPSMNQSGFGTS